MSGGERTAVFRDIDTLLAQRSEALALLDKAFENFTAVEHLVEASGIHFSLASYLRQSYPYRLGESNRRRAMRDLTKLYDRGLWTEVLARTNMRAMMDATALAEWDKEIQAGPPECTIETLEATFGALHENRQLIFRRGVVNAFKALSGNYRTNDAFKIGPKIIIQSLVGSRHREQELTDIERIHHVLDGKAPPEYGQSILRSVPRWNRPARCEAEDEYLHIRFFANGNAHVRFKRPDLIAECNRTIAAFYAEDLPNGRRK